MRRRRRCTERCARPVAGATIRTNMSENTTIDRTPNARLAPGRLLGLSFLITLVVWMIFTWPLPQYVTDGIPAAHGRVEAQDARYMIPGDHLQLLYYFWIFGDMLRGDTPWFYNLYEFNTGDDEARYDRSTYYFPFSLFYAAFEPIGGRAFAFNATGFIGLWLTYLFTWLLVRRYVKNEWIAGSLALVGILLPFRWFAFLGGSPTGYGMTWVPLLLLGLDHAVRNNRISGGWIAGLAIVLSFSSDVHVFFFNVLIIPAWCVVALAAREEFDWRVPAAWRALVIALLPAAVLAIATVLYSRAGSLDLADTHMAEGRELVEVMGFSPDRKGLFAWEEHPISSQIYVGYTIIALLLAGSIASARRLLRRRRREDWRPAIVLGLLLALFGGVALLAVGPHGPFGGRAFLWARDLIPPYAMIRQTGKIFSLMPSLLAVAGALSLAALLPPLAKRRTIVLFTLIPALLLIGEYGRRTHPTISLLQTEQPAYAAVADDAATDGLDPHALVVTLWPGDTHYASIYQHFVSLYRIRMINGYTPAIRVAYLEDVFLRFQSINQGWMSDEQADNLMARGIRYVVVHEDIFPEKVSPFPIAQTLKRFHDHPRMRFLAQSGSVWSFKILEEPQPRPAWMPEWTRFFPARHYEFEHIRRDALDIRQDEQASNREYARLARTGDYVTLLDTATPPAPDLHWKVRLRGEGAIQMEILVDGETVREELITVREPDWHWSEWTIPLEDYGTVNLRCTLIDGALDFDMALLGSGQWPDLKPGESVRIPAPLFCHAGHITGDRESVLFRPLHDRSGFVFYGPKLPFEAGTYTVDLDITSDAPDGFELGVVHIGIERYPVPDVIVPVIAGQDTRATWTQPVNLPFNVVLVYHSTARMEVHGMTFTRMD